MKKTLMALTLILLLTLALTACFHEHEIVTDAAVAPTCTQSGLTEGSHCATCGEIIVPQNTVDALGHAKVTDAAKAPTCTKTGLTQGSHCSTCGEIIVPQNTVNALGHTKVIDAAVAPTCTKTGLTRGAHCSVCNATISAQTVVEKTAHTYDSVDDSQCNVCGYTRKISFSVGLTYELNEEGMYVVAGIGKCTDVNLILPDSLDGIPVVEIKSHAFNGNKTLKTVKIGNNVRLIDGSAFFGCSNLTNVTLGLKVEEIGAQAFSYCTSLTSFVIPTSVTCIRPNVFYMSNNMRSVTFLDTTTWYISHILGKTYTVDVGDPAINAEIFAHNTYRMYTWYKK